MVGEISGGGVSESRHFTWDLGGFIFTCDERLLKVIEDVNLN